MSENTPARASRTSVAARKPSKRRGKRAAGRQPRAEADLIAQFAAALAGTSRTPKRRSLMVALQQSALTSPLDVMPGVRAAGPDIQHQPFSAEVACAPCLRPHDERRRLARLHATGGWCLAAIVSVAIISATTALLMAVPGGEAHPRLQTADAGRY